MVYIGNIYMNLRQLRTFLAVAHTGSFTAAAREVHLTQPTVSTGVADLEHSMGVRLFNRSGRRISLTLEGRQLMSYAERIQDLVTEARDRVGKGDLEGAEGFRFGAIDAAVIYLIPELLAAYHRRFPEIEVEVPAMDEARMDGPSPHFQNERVELGVSWTPAPSSASWGGDSLNDLVG